MNDDNAKLATANALPGFGLPVMTLPQWQCSTELQLRFPHAIPDRFASAGITLREIRMLDFINKITDEPKWHRKVFDPAIVADWKQKAVVWNETLPEKGDYTLSEKMFDCCMLELKEKAKVFEENGYVAVLDAEATVVKSDKAVSEDLKEQLNVAVNSLKDVPGRLKNGLQASDRKVQELVDPSLFPVAYARTRVLSDRELPLDESLRFCGAGVTLPAFGAPNSNGNQSKIEREPSMDSHVNSGGSVYSSSIKIDKGWTNFQWLPSDAKVNNDGTSRISSYINNLHPKRHAALYPILERFIDAAIPLWDDCLSKFHSRLRIDKKYIGSDDYYVPGNRRFPREQYAQSPKHHTDSEDESESDSDDEEPDQLWAMDHDCEQEYRSWWLKHRVLLHPEPVFTPGEDLVGKPGARPVHLKSDFANQGLQIIFKISEIHLTPDKPIYSGGTWHFDGSLNEHICATARYYWDEENITESNLAFRLAGDMTLMRAKSSWAQDLDEYDSAAALFGLKEDDPVIFELGAVKTRPGRMVAYPNVLQHCENPFQLQDMTKPGHRKVLTIFLVDPHIRVLSTARVPPQNRFWWAQELREIERFAALPEEIFEMIIDSVDEFPLSWDTASMLRQMLLEERDILDEHCNDVMTRNTFQF